MKTSLHKILNGLAVGAVLFTAACDPAAKDTGKESESGHWPPDPLPAYPTLAPTGWVNTGLSERDGSFTPAMDEFYYSLDHPRHTSTTIMLAKRATDGEWNEPEIAPFSGRYPDIEPFITSDGQWCYFASRRPLDGKGAIKDWDLWRVARVADGWGQPEPLSRTVNTNGNEFYPSVAANGNLYFTAGRDDGYGKEDIWWAAANGSDFDPPLALNQGVNSPGWEYNAWVSPDERTLIYTAYGRADDLGRGDLYVSQRNVEGLWLPGIHLPEPINSADADYCPGIAPDRKTFTFTSDRITVTQPDSMEMDATMLIKRLNRPGNGLDDIYVMDFSVIQKVLDRQSLE